MKSLSVLIITDIHYVGAADHICSVRKRRATLALELVQKVLHSVDSSKIDVVLLLGDLVDNGNAPGAESDMQDLQSALEKVKKPVLVVPGNHDINAEAVFKVFSDYEGLHEIEGYQFITFADTYHDDHTASRSWAKMEEAFSRADPGKPIIVLQHNPVYPPIDKAYPYNINEANRVMEFYSRQGVLLSISGHAHWGIPDTVKDGVGYLTCPALCEAPFRYTILTLKEKEYSTTEHQLLLPEEWGLSDLHTHTHYAYCGENVTPMESIRRAKEYGLKRVAFTEHSAQLYVSSKDYWSARFINEPEILRQNRNTPLDRMKQYREEMKLHRCDAVRVGLEVEVDCNGDLTLLEEDRSGWDLLIGAVHYLPQRFEAGSKEGFMWANEVLLRSGVQILAHPFRYFIRSKQPVPVELYRPLVELLAGTGIAVELNYHTNDNDPRFFELCLEHGIPIALGSDAHHLSEIGTFNRHLGLLKQICPEDRLSSILYY